MAAAAGRSLLLFLSSRGGGAGAGGCGALTAGCFPGLGVSRHRQQQQQQHHRTVFYYHCYSGWQDIVSTSLSMYHASDILAARVWSWPVGVKCTKGFLGRIWVLFIAVLLCPLMILRNGMAGSYDVTVVYQNGLPVISVRLPSRRERCQFTLKPISDSVGVFLRQLQEEDRGIDRVAIYSPDLLSHENAATLNDVKTLVQQLYTTLCIEQHQLSKERELIERLEDLKEQLAPLEKVRLEISRKAEKRTTLVLWGGLAYMATQFGILARLTWWEYSWDIMEPVTYFITYGSAMAMYAYFVVTRQEYVYPEARDRQYLLFFHKGAKKSRFDLEKYNKLKDAIAQAEMDLKRLRDPLQVHLPLRQIGEKN
ncbi:calcium uniporter protein, mitochondrial isoform X2 [Pipistrellus kuhlii]|uniref:calcium uniporter protein, mitochondrial isoform X2 n=1 Tax=Pipistrellus kuhlii TaxID=59472 RepID=UPI00174F40EF|nr:calcium uniporter protein, mitochondrial isoform X2 [Pipistrellus kuhlii]